jgi:hypothetical protein
MKIIDDRWRPGLLAAVAVTILAIYPQLNLWMARGSEWKGSYVLVQGDEIAYSAYINSLIDGRPRKNDTFMGRDDSPDSPLGESLFSIQFIPAYVIALPARLLRLSASTAFIILICIIAFTSCLVLFWLIRSITGDPSIAAAGALATLCLGTLAAAQGEVSVFLVGSYVYDFFPFLRRYQPGLSFPTFFLFCGLVWHAVTSETKHRVAFYSIASGLTLAVLVFSYFYMWTAALGWLSCFGLALFIGRARERKVTTAIIGTIVALGLAAIIPFFILLSYRAGTMDSTQLLTVSHAPALFYPAEFIAAVILGMLVFVVRRGKHIDCRNPLFLITVSFAATPFVLFNQQVLTGRSLQPIHYQLFIANYLVVLAAVLTALIFWKEFKGREKMLPRKAIAYGAMLALAWGIVEVAGSTRRNAPYARIRDDSMPAINMLANLARQSGTNDPVIMAGQASHPIVYSTNLNTAGNIPTASPDGVLWAQHTPAAGVSLEESKRRYYCYLYYSGADEKELAKAMAEGQFNTLTALFGMERVVPSLSARSEPITPDEMRDEIRRYSQFISTFTKNQAADPVLSYILAPSVAEPNYSNLDRWYIREVVAEVGIYRIYRLRLRD